MRKVPDWVEGMRFQVLQEKFSFTEQKDCTFLSRKESCVRTGMCWGISLCIEGGQVIPKAWRKRKKSWRYKKGTYLRHCSEDSFKSSVKMEEKYKIDDH